MTTEQQALFDKATKDNDWPALTMDPYVNWMIDKMVCKSDHPYDEEMYKEEIQAFIASNMIPIS